MSLLKFSRSFWETAVAYKGSDENILRDYDILKEKQDGKTLEQIAIKHSISRRRVCAILSKYRK